MTPVPTVTAVPAATFSPTPLPRVLRICMGAEPESLYLYGDSSYAAQLVRQAIYDGPIDTLGYAYRPVAVERVPSLADGDAFLEQTPVEPGMRVVDDAGEVITLAEGARVRPAGCRSSACAVLFAGQPLDMDVLHAVFVLKEGLAWSDGEPVTAADSVYSFELARNPATPTGKHRELRTDSYEAVDDRTVEWIGLPGFVDPEYQMAFWMPLPSHVWGSATAAQLLGLDAATRQPLSYGAYQITDWEPGGEIRLRPNPYYFRAAEGLPAFDELVFAFLPSEDVEDVLDSLIDGRCDLLTWELSPDRGYERLLAMSAEGDAQVLAVSGTVWEHLTFAVSPADKDQPAFFADVAARRAVAHCIDRIAVAASLTGGVSYAPNLYLARDHPLVTGGYPTYPYAPERGQAMLEELGWRDEDGDGVREAHGVVGIREGTAFSIVYATTPSDARLQVSQQITEDLAACGIAAVVETAPVQEFYAQSPAGVVYPRRFDIAQFAWLTGVHPPCELYLSDAIPSDESDWSGDNVGGYSSLAFDEACRQARTSLPGEPALVQAHWEAQRIFAETLPALPLYYRPKIIAARPDLAGILMDPIAVETVAIESFQRR